MQELSEESTMLNTNVSTTIDGKLKQLPLEARHSICLELSKKRRQSVASSIFIPKKNTDPATTPKPKPASLCPSNIRKIPSLNSRKLSKFEQRRKKFKQLKLNRSIKMPKKYKFFTKPTPTPLRHPESFPIVRTTVDRERVRSIVESLRHGMTDSEASSSPNSNRGEESCSEVLEESLKSHPIVNKGIDMPILDGSATESEQPPETSELGGELSTANCCATLATEPYMITVDLSGLEVAEEEVDCPQMLDNSKSEHLTGEGSVNVEANVNEDNFEVLENETFYNNNNDNTMGYSDMTASKSQGLSMSNFPHNETEPSTLKYADYAMEKQMEMPPLEESISDQVIDLSCPAEYRLPETTPAAAQQIPLALELITPPSQHYYQPSQQQQPHHHHQLPPQQQHLSPSLTPQKTRLSKRHKWPTHHHHQTPYPLPDYSCAPSFYNSPRKFSTNSLHYPNVAQSEPTYAAAPSITPSSYQRHATGPFETPPVSPHELPPWMPTDWPNVKQPPPLHNIAATPLKTHHERQHSAYAATPPTRRERARHFNTAGAFMYAPSTMWPNYMEPHAVDSLKVNHCPSAYNHPLSYAMPNVYHPAEPVMPPNASLYAETCTHLPHCFHEGMGPYPPAAYRGYMGIPMHLPMPYAMPWQKPVNWRGTTSGEMLRSGGGAGAMNFNNYAMELHMQRKLKHA